MTRQGSLLAGIAAALLIVAPAPGVHAQTAYEPSSSGTRILEAESGLTIKMLVEASNLGGAEVEVGEVTFPVGSGAQGGGHRHAHVEIFYILSGTFDHVVNGEAHRLGPGMVGIVRPGDEVIHRVIGDEPVRAVVVWAPGGEAARIAPGFTEKPVPPPF
jgi:quercetin dioxygenase-like cupin family protein